MLPYWDPQMGSRGAMSNFLLREQHQERMGEHNPLAGSDRRDRKPRQFHGELVFRPRALHSEPMV